jgi:hypothetical protein
MLRYTALPLLLGIALAGCASEGLTYAVREYRGVPIQDYLAPDQASYRVFDKPTANKMMITPSLGEAMSVGFTRGATFGAAGNPNWQHRMIEAAKAFLASTGRTCQIVGSSMIVEPQWEIAYECRAPIAATAKPSRS